MVSTPPQLRQRQLQHREVAQDGSGDIGRCKVKFTHTSRRVLFNVAGVRDTLRHVGHFGKPTTQRAIRSEDGHEFSGDVRAVLMRS